MLNVVMLNVVMLSVAAPLCTLIVRDGADSQTISALNFRSEKPSHCLGGINKRVFV
jgi:hypothetical protein